MPLYYVTLRENRPHFVENEIMQHQRVHLLLITVIFLSYVEFASLFQSCVHMCECNQYAILFFNCTR